MGLFNRGKDTPSSTEALSPRPLRALAKSTRTLTIGELEAALLKEFPPAQAESWDKMGVLVGERALPVTGVAVALDATVAAVQQAAAQGANVLLTHHPAFLNAPTSFAPEVSSALSPGAVVWAAIQHQVALLNVHTALDVTRTARALLPTMLALKPANKPVVPLAINPALGYGEYCTVPADSGEPETLGHLAARCTAVFGRAPRVWGNMDAPVQQAVCATGSAGSVADVCAREHIDCLICGEVRYHAALEVSAAGCGIIELGHDVSELPLAALLADAAASAGVSKGQIALLDQTHNWCHPEATRI